MKDLDATHKFTRPHCPWQNGKVERRNRTQATEWAYRRGAYTSNAERTAALAPWLERYNTERIHSAHSEERAQSTACHHRDGRVHR